MTNATKTKKAITEQGQAGQEKSSGNEGAKASFEAAQRGKTNAGTISRYADKLGYAAKSDGGFPVGRVGLGSADGRAINQCVTNGYGRSRNAAYVRKCAVSLADVPRAGKYASRSSARGTSSNQKPYSEEEAEAIEEARDSDEEEAGGKSPFKRVRELYKFCCNPMCGSSEWLEVHHIKHRSQGGDNSLDNLVLICHHCHTRHHSIGDLDIVNLKTMVRFVDKSTGVVADFTRVPHLSGIPVELVDTASAVNRWLELSHFSEELKKVSMDALGVLYDLLREMKSRAWQAQCAVIAELQARAHYGDAATDGIAQTLGVSRRTVQYRGKVYREILSQPDCADIVADLTEESWYKEAVDTDKPKEWIRHAAEKKAVNPDYTIQAFRAEIQEKQPPTVEMVILVCKDPTQADYSLAERLQRSLGVSVVIRPVPVETLQDTL